MAFVVGILVLWLSLQLKLTSVSSWDDILYVINPPMKYKEVTEYSSPGAPYKCTKPILVKRYLSTNQMGDPWYGYKPVNSQEASEFCRVSGVY